MRKEHHIITARDLIDQIKKLPSVPNLVDNKTKRADLSSLYRQVMNIGSIFPSPDKNMNLLIAQKLNKRVSRTCPACVKPDAMKRFVETALTTLERYAERLSVWIDGDSVESSDKKQSVHDMRPTKDE